MQKNRLKRMPKTVHKPILNILKTIRKEIDSLDQQLDKLIATIPQWRERVDQLISAKGVGKVLAYTLLSELPELGQLNRKRREHAGWTSGWKSLEHHRCHNHDGSS